MRVSIKEVMKDTDLSDLSNEQLENLIVLMVKVNMLREEVGRPFNITSGYRSPEHNARIGGAKQSNHMRCAAVDIADADGSLKKLLMKDDNALLKKYDLYMESAEDAPTWAHLQIVPPRSGSRVFGR